MGTTPPPAPAKHKSRRKISLPWFRQSSVSAPHATLSRQHTIDTPSSFNARLLKGNRQRQAGPEMTWVIYEHTSGGTGELTVTKGQQVEVVEPWTTRPDWWVVRVPGEPPLEGAVPAQVLKPQPQHPPHKTSPSRRPLSQPCEETLEASNSDPGSSVSAASPGKQRRGFSGWLGLRKTTQGKGEKTPSGGQSPATSNNASAPAPPPITAPATTSTSANSAPASSTVPIPAPTAAQAAASLAPSAAANATSGSSANNTEKTPAKKMSAEKKLKFPSFVNNVRSDDSIDSELGACAVLDEAEDDLPDVELPPPMKPIQDPQAVLQQAPSTAVPADATPAALQQHGGAANVQEPTGEEAGQEGEALPIHTPEELAILKKREYVLRELIDTEEIYVSDLRLICEGYMRHMQDPHGEPTLPDNLRDRRYRMIFGNIEAIYEWHRDKFLRELRMSLTHPELLGTLFRRFLEKRLYESYCRNKPVSEYIVSEHEHYFQELRHKLGHKLQLGDLLIKPIQRIQKYHLLVKKILSYSEQANCPPHVLAGLREAVHCTDIIPKNANLMMNFGRLQGFTGNITAQGKLLLHETMMVSDNPSGTDKGKELNVFLFEQCVIFSEAVGKRSQFTSPTYNYKGHVQVNKMELEEAEALGGFIIHSVSLKKPRHSFLCRAPDGKRQEWVSTLSNILQSQRIFGEALENPGAYLREQQHRDNNREHNTVGEGWCGLHYVPLSLDGRPELRQRTQRPHTKANTINLPTTTTTRSEDRKKAAASVASSAFSPTSPPHANGLSKRPWGLKLRRGGSAASGSNESSTEGHVVELRAPELAEPASDVTVAPGASASLACRARATRATASWRKTAPETRALRHGGRFAITFTPDGLATLTIHACRASDAGVYCCLVSNELGGVQTSARLTVGSGGTPGVPAVRAHPGGGLVVHWDEPSPTHLEYCRVGEGEWRRATETPATANTLALEELPAGQYSFRLLCARSGAPGPASGPAACGGGGAWQREQFARRYSVEEEIGRGRTARVLAARDTGTGQRVALKQVLAGRGADATREYKILSRTAHGAVVRALALFAEVPRAGAHTLVLELVGGGPLLDWAAANPALYTQQTVAHHTRQLLSALDWFHTINVAHLDVRPENILVELGGVQPQLKLVDLGSAVETIDGGAGNSGREVLPPAPAQLEFAPPECVLGRPPAPAWDAWAAGVFLYVFLTGLSPFLDESIEETTANIIKCDYCFPPEHWSGIEERAQQIIRGLLDPAPANRLSPHDALKHSWFDEAPSTLLSATQLKTFLDRRRPSGHGNALHSLRSPNDT